MNRSFDTSSPARDDLISGLTGATVEIYTALGAIRLLTLFPLFAPGLSEVEQQLGRALNGLIEIRRQLEDEEQGRR